MPKEYKTKLESGEMLSFRVSRKHRLAFTNYCDENGLNESAVLRIMLIKIGVNNLMLTQIILMVKKLLRVITTNVGVTHY